jgi:glutathione-specific gamma-glutamylcyclotransferase
MQQFWIFGYGSLMWRPGFEYVASERALIRGYHRSLCVYSYVHRGTPQSPGLVLGLDRGGSCHGIAFQIEPAKWDDTISYLRAREQVTKVYLETTKRTYLTERQQTVDAITYIVDRKHQQYAGALSPENILPHVLEGNGISGHCVDYVMNTVNHLRDMEIHDTTLEAVVERL